MRKKKQIDYKEFIKLYKEGLMDRELGEALNITRRLATTVRNRLNLVPNNQYRVFINKERFLELISLKYSFSKIAKEFNCSVDTIAAFGRKLNVSSNYTLTCNTNTTKYLKLYKEGLDDVEISKQCNITSGAVQSFRKRNNLPKNFSYSKFRTIDYTMVEKLSKENIGDEEIAKLLNCSSDGVWNVRKTQGFTRRSLVKNELIDLTAFQKQVLIGTVLGDSSLRLGRSNETPSLICSHSIKQKELVEKLTSIFLNYDATIRDFSRYDKRTDKIYTGSIFVTKSNPAFTPYRNLFYPEGTKIIPKEIYNDFTDVSLAYLFMDDGTKCKSGYSIATMCFTKEDVDFLRNLLFEKFGLETSRHKRNEIYIKNTSKELFKQIVSPYILDCVQYKL